MPRTIEQYLAELRMHLSGRLPDKDLEGFLVETEQHLRSSVEDVAEGQRPISEHEATERFGAPQDVARTAARVCGSGRRYPWILAIAAMIPFLYLVWLSIVWDQVHDTNLFAAMRLAFSAVAMGWVWYSAATRRPYWSVVAATGVGSMLALPALASYLFVTIGPPRQQAYVPRLVAENYVATANEYVASVKIAEKACTSVKGCFATYAYLKTSPVIWNRLGRDGLFVVPVPYPGMMLMGKGLFTRHPSAAEFQKNELENFELKSAEAKSYAETVASQLKEPALGQYTAFLGATVNFMFLYFLSLIVLNFIGIGIGNLARTIRRGRAYA